MKYFYLFIGTVTFVMILILFFQLLTALYVTVPFFTEWIDAKIFISIVIALSYISGVTLTLGFSKFMASNNMDDDFDL